MEIYTGDFADIAEDFADKIKAKLPNDYAIADGCVDLMIHLKRVIHTRLCDAFKEVAEEHTGIENSELERDLYKIINEL